MKEEGLLIVFALTAKDESEGCVSRFCFEKEQGFRHLRVFLQNVGTVLLGARVRAQVRARAQARVLGRAEPQIPLPSGFKPNCSPL